MASCGWHGTQPNDAAGVAAQVAKQDDKYGCKRMGLNEKITISDFDLHKVGGGGRGWRWGRMSVWVYSSGGGVDARMPDWCTEPLLIHPSIHSFSSSSSSSSIHSPPPPPIPSTQVVGKGAFGKVMLVKKRRGVGKGSVYAMKVLKKSVIVEKGQIEHTLSERAILLQIQHPFIVRLRFAFQNEHNLYLVTDYYSGGTLFAHLRKAGCFDEKRARFYAAEILLALDHLHQQHIIYRDLKCENVLVDNDGESDGIAVAAI